jgi:hypothetical protein
VSNVETTGWFVDIQVLAGLKKLLEKLILLYLDKKLPEFYGFHGHNSPPFTLS